MRRSARVALANGTSVLCARIDVLVVAAVLSASAAGVYSIPVALAANLLLLSRSLLTATYRPIMTAPEDQVAGRLSTAVRHSVIVVLVGGGLSIPVVAVASGFVFGDAYADIWQPYSLLVLASACICVVEVLRHFLLTRLERQNEFVVVVTAMLIVNGVLAAVGAAAFGLVGAAASTTITYALAAFALVAICARRLDVSMRELGGPARVRPRRPIGAPSGPDSPAVARPPWSPRSDGERAVRAAAAAGAATCAPRRRCRA